jgi:hypothetical protein
MTEFDGVVTILNKPAPAGQGMIVLNGQLADATLGGNGQIGALVLKNSEGTEIARLGHQTSTPFLKPGTKPGTMPMPVGPASGALVLRDSSGAERVHVDAMMAGGELALMGKDGTERFRVNGSTGDASVGGNGADGDVTLKSASSNRIVTLNAGDGDEIQVCEDTAAPKIVFAFDKNAYGNTRAGLFLGAHSTQGGKKPGIISIRDEAGNDGVVFSAAKDGDEIAVDQKPGVRTLAFDKNAYGDTKAGLFIGVHVSQGGKRPGIIALRDKTGNDSLLLDGEKGDIVLMNADCAENFEVSESVEPGTVMVLGDDGSLRSSDSAYDTRVAGVVAGAGSYRPGIVLDGGASGDNRLPISLVGKVFCKVDDSNGAIEVGALLTTSTTPGHAMRASDAGRAFGAVIGKALAPHPRGNGLIPVLVGLQ